MNLVLIAVIVVAGLIWLMSGLKSYRHKVFAFFLIFILFLSVFGFTATFSGKNIEINSVGDLGNAVKLYFSWYGTLFNNIKILTANAVKLDWRANQTT